MKTPQDSSMGAVRPMFCSPRRLGRASSQRAARRLLGGSLVACVLVAGCANSAVPVDEAAALQAECTSPGCERKALTVDPSVGIQSSFIWSRADATPGPAECPDGFSLVGTPGARGAFCITQQQVGPARFLEAQAACFAMETSTGDIPYLCTQHEWYVACEIEPNWDQPALSKLIDGEEWVADMEAQGSAITMGAGACGTVKRHPIQQALPYRCCVR